MRDQSETPVSESEFYMWRTVFALAHVDHNVSEREVTLMSDILKDISFTDEQRAALEEDIKRKQDPAEMFKQISDEKDRLMFFQFAHDMVWVDGEYGREEQEIMLKLYQKHVLDTNVDDLIGKVKLELEDDSDQALEERVNRKDNKRILQSFRDRFLQERFS